MISNRLHLFFPILVAVILAASCTEGSRSGDGDSSSEAGTDLGGASGIGGSEATGKLGSTCEDISECLNGLICSSGECQDPQEAVLSCIKQCGPAECVAENLACDAQTGCLEVVDCQFACKADDSACVEACVPTSISEQAVNALDSYYGCIVDECEACLTIADIPTGGGGSGSGTGGDTSSGGSSSGVGGNGVVLPSGCESVTRATGSPKIIDDFDHLNFPHFPDEGDGRVGTWEHQYWAASGPPNSIAPLRVLDGEENGHVRFSCNKESWCNTAWDVADPWEQWASLSTLLGEYSEDGPSCYDASIYSGIRFDAKSASGNDLILVQLTTPDSNPDEGWNYKSFEYPLGTEWDGIEIPFSTILMPSWVASFGGPSGAVDPEVLISLSIVVRTVQNHTDGLSVVGENLLPYDIEIDNLRFY